MSEPGQPTTAPVPVDAHVHFHPCFEAVAFLDAAVRNFRRAAARADLAAPGAALLVLTEAPGEEALRRLTSSVGGSPGWRVDRTREEASALAVRSDGARLVLAAGRQVPTAEGIEVLALGRRDVEVDGRPVAEVLAAVRGAGALPVVPWGFGKWWLGRGRVVRRLLEREDPAELFLGDNGGRPRVFLRPALLSEAAKRGIRDLPGSDPLPFPRETERAGSRGFLLDRPLDPRRPVAGLIARLREPDFRPVGFGSGADLGPFLRNQVALRMRRVGLRA